jgi:phosphate acyltransferase
MNIGLDMMGGDFAPAEAVKGVQLFSKQFTTVNIFCIGDEALVKPLFGDSLASSPNLHFIQASQIIGYNEHPTKALKEKPNSSISIGFHLLATGKIDAFISAGNTGAMLVGAMFSIKVIEGVLRPTIATIVPKLSGKTGLIADVGLNADCKPEHLNQFAILGSLYAKNIMGIDSPTIGLINIGEEEGKGNILTQAAYPLLKENKQLQFIGNIEGRDFFNDKADVMVCDGFTGNVVLKMAETLYDVAKARNLENDEYFNRFHYENYGGTPVLGVAKPVIIGHGISSDIAFKNMLILAEKMIATNVCGKMKDAFSVS